MDTIYGPAQVAAGDLVNEMRNLFTWGSKGTRNQEVCTSFRVRIR